MPWRRDFPSYQVPRTIQNLVDRGRLEDVSDPRDPAPSFVTRLPRGWLRLWVEHPDYAQRHAGPHRYRVEVTRDLAEEGRVLIQDDVLKDILPTLLAAIDFLSQRSRFRLLGAHASLDRHPLWAMLGRVGIALREWFLAQ